MNVFRVNPTDQALTDAGEAYFWLNQHSPTAALRCPLVPDDDTDL